MKKTFSVFYCLFFCILFWNSVNAQNDTFPSGLKNEINYAFENFKKKDSIAIEKELESSLKNEYYDELINAKPDDFGDKRRELRRAKKLIKFYSTAPGIEEVLNSWIRMIDADYDRILSLRELIQTTITEKSRTSPVLWAPPNNPNKYATLFVKDKVSSNGEIYLNNQFICTTQDAKNGIRVQSDTKYKLELKLETSIYCKSTVILASQERKTIDCSK